MNVRQIERKARIEKIKSLLRRTHDEDPLKSLSYNKIVALLMADDGLARRTAREHIDCLIVSGFCKRDEDEIYIE